MRVIWERIHEPFAWTEVVMNNTDTHRRARRHIASINNGGQAAVRHLQEVCGVPRARKQAAREQSGAGHGYRLPAASAISPRLYVTPPHLHEALATSGCKHVDAAEATQSINNAQERNAIKTESEFMMS